MKRIRVALVALILSLLLIGMGCEWAWAKHYGRSCVDDSCDPGYNLDDITGMEDGETAVIPNDPTYGVLHYEYKDPDASSELLPTVVQPDSGTGRWLIHTNPVGGGGTGATTATGARTNLSAQGWHANLDDFADITAEKGGVPFWDSATTMDRLRFNAADVEGQIVHATGTYPNTVPALTDTLNLTNFLFPKGDDPATSTEAECKWDKNNRALECYDDSSQLLALMQKINTAIIPSPESLPVSIVTIMDGHETSFPFGVVLKAAWIDCNDKPAANYVVVIEEWTDGNDSTIQAHSADCGTLTLTGATDYENEITSFSDANIAAGNLVKADFDDTDWAAEAGLEECRIGVIYEIEDGS